MSDTLIHGNVLAHTFRAYIADMEVRQTSFFQQSLQRAQQMPCLSVSVSPGMIHRKVWAMLNSLGAAVTVRWQLVATLNGREVFRWTMAYWNTANTPQYYMNYGVPGTVVGGMGEQLTIKLAGSTVLMVAPTRINIACDTIYIDSTGTTGAGLWDAYLFVTSQTGV